MASFHQDKNFIPSGIVACALRLSEKTLCVKAAAGQFPAPDRRGLGNIKMWRPETIRAHDPRLADRVQRVLAALDDSPAIAA